MPELPEVETYIRELQPLLAGKTVQRVQVAWPRIIAAPTPESFAAKLPGRRFVAFARRGKYMLLGLDDGSTLVVHLRMTGALRLHPADAPEDKHTHVVFHLDTGERLHYRDPRKFGRLWLVEDVESVVGKLGPEPLGEAFQPDVLAGALAGRRAAIKAVLLDQRIVAGIGNIYADEALFAAGVDPRRPAGSLSREEIAALHRAIRDVLSQAIALRGSSMKDYAPPSGERGGFQEVHQVFRRTGAPCPRCGTLIQRTVIAQRSTHYCPGCQR